MATGEKQMKDFDEALSIDNEDILLMQTSSLKTKKIKKVNLLAFTDEEYEEIKSYIFDDNDN